MIFNIDSILEELYNLQRLGIKVGLDHTNELLKAILAFCLIGSFDINFIF